MVSSDIVPYYLLYCTIRIGISGRARMDHPIVLETEFMANLSNISKLSMFSFWSLDFQSWHWRQLIEHPPSHHGKSMIQIWHPGSYAHGGTQTLQALDIYVACSFGINL